MKDAPNFKEYEYDTCDDCKHVIHSDTIMAFPRGCSKHTTPERPNTNTVCDSWEINQ